MTSWKKRLEAHISPELAEQIDSFDSQMTLRGQQKISETLFAEARLRRGIYGQRYDNGLRHNGIEQRSIALPEHASKGPNTAWHAPGMMRLKIPYGALTPRQLEVIADLADEYADGILHPTTRQDIQLHYVHIDDTPDLMRRLAAVGITTQEACGNSVRNITACPMAGVCAGQAFDITPYARATVHFLLGHDDVQDFGRKFKIAFSGCADSACALTSIHDLGFIAKTRGDGERGFAVYVGGGLGAIPHRARLLESFLPIEELLPITQAICRVFARDGEKNNRAKARIKFLLAKLGIDAFRARVAEERNALVPDPRWTDFLEHERASHEQPRSQAEPLPALDPLPRGVAEWIRGNLRPQRQKNFYAAHIALPLGDMTSRQARQLGAIARQFSALDPNSPSLRVSVEQNIVLRWVSGDDAEPLYRALSAAELAAPGFGVLVDVTACPGTDTCKLGIASSRGLAAELRTTLAELAAQKDAAVRQLRIKISGCFNSCGQHHIADIGFYGVSRKVQGVTLPHFQVVLGGRWDQNAAQYGLAIGAIPSRAIPAATRALINHYLEQRAEPNESFATFVRRLGKRQIKAWLAAFTHVPSPEFDPDFYRDWGDTREFTIGDRGVGECAGQVVSASELGLAQSESIAFQAQEHLDHDDGARATRLAYEAMISAARTLLLARSIEVVDDAEQVVRAFRREFYDTKLFFDPFAGGKFANYLLRAEQDSAAPRQRVEEAQLFIEAAHACHARLG